MRFKSEINPGKEVQMRPLLLSMAMMPAVAATHPAAKRQDGVEHARNISLMPRQSFSAP